MKFQVFEELIGGSYSSVMNDRFPCWPETHSGCLTHTHTLQCFPTAGLSTVTSLLCWFSLMGSFYFQVVLSQSEIQFISLSAVRDIWRPSAKKKKTFWRPLCFTMNRSVKVQQMNNLNSFIKFTLVHCIYESIYFTFFLLIFRPLLIRLSSFSLHYY